MIALMAMMMLAACGNAGDTADTESADTTAEVTEEDTAGAETETTPEVDTSSLDEIIGDYEMRPVEIWETTGEVYQSGEDLVLHMTVEDNEYYMALADGSVYEYFPDQKTVGSEALYTYTFEKGVLKLTTMDENTTWIFKKEGAE